MKKTTITILAAVLTVLVLACLPEKPEDNGPSTETVPTTAPVESENPEDTSSPEGDTTPEA